ncbi:Uncharacterized protein CTYZ_00003241 [Cryptosporidium tyzzeri]|nr:Uncharacterized protein CTYZ_00003241 [Cryptosporidium tyzzeri]
MKLFLKSKKHLILYFNLIIFSIKSDKSLSNNNNFTPTRDFGTLFNYKNFQELNKNIPNSGELNLFAENIQANRIYEKNDFEKKFKTKEKNSVNRTRGSRTNELHKFSKYWLKKLGIPKEVPPSAWCNEDGVIVGIPITKNVSKILNEKIKSINGREVPVITEDFLDNFFEQNYNGQLYSKGLSIACSGKAVISNSFYEISGKFEGKNNNSKK